MKKRKPQIEGERNSILMSEMIQKHKVTFMHPFTPTIKNKILTNATENIPPDLLNLMQVEEITPFLQLFLFLFRLRELIEGGIRNAGLFSEFYALLGEPRNLGYKVLRKINSNTMEGDSVIGPFFEESLGDMRLTTFKTLQITSHISFLHDFPDFLASFPSLTIFWFLFARLTSHIQRKKHTLEPEKPDAENGTVGMDTGNCPIKRATDFPEYVRYPTCIHIRVLTRSEKTSRKVTTP